MTEKETPRSEWDCPTCGRHAQHRFINDSYIGKQYYQDKQGYCSKCKVWFNVYALIIKPKENKI